MKRKNNLYSNIYNLKNIETCFNEVCKNMKNKKKVYVLKEYKCIYISRIYRLLSSKTYVPEKYNIFTVYEPKKRLIFSQTAQDKIINHLVARYILYPAILPCLLPVNVASRQGLGTDAGLRIVRRIRRNCKIKYNKYYILKCDIHKFFPSIDHDILKKKIKCRIKDEDALKILDDIIDSVPSGLGIGSMTSQVLAIFYLNDFDHFVKEVLHIKYYVRYQDDFLLFSNSKTYLEYCLVEIKEFLAKEKLELNSKTRIYSSDDNYIFLGRNCKRCTC